jgi:TM2 domain-containing membrane protein YozV
MSSMESTLPPREAASAIPMRQATNAQVPPHPLDKQWFAHVDGQNYGPYTGHEIRQMINKGQIIASDFLCGEGGSAWTQAKNDPLLGALFRSRSETTQTHASPVTANGGTIVQVTNNIPNFANAALLLDPGAAGAKSPGVALLLSLLICGVGQMYNGQVGKGILMLIGAVLAWIVLLGWIVWIWSMIDAYQTAKQMNIRYQQRLLAGLM